MSIQSKVLTGLATLLALTVGGDLALAMANRSTQANIAERATFIQQSVALERLNQEIIRALAELAVRTQDNAVLALLNANGITFNITQQQTESEPAPAPAVTTESAAVSTAVPVPTRAPATTRENK